MGENPYETPRQYWEVRTGRRQKEFDNRFMAHGRENEAMVRDAYARILGEPLIPQTYESTRLPVLRASVDGITFDGDIIGEFKCPSTPKVYEAARQGYVIPYYYGQVQAQLYVTGAKVCHFVVYYAPVATSESLNLVLVRVEPDFAYWARMEVEILAMWARIQNDAWEESAGSEDLNNDEQFGMLAARWLELKSQITPLQVALEAVEAEIKKKAAGRKEVYGCGLRVKENKRKGNVDYAKVPELKGVDLEPYRKGTSYFYTIEEAASGK